MVLGPRKPIIGVKTTFSAPISAVKRQIDGKNGVVQVNQLFQNFRHSIWGDWNCKISCLTPHDKAINEPKDVDVG